jgi:hypothetical protein
MRIEADELFPVSLFIGPIRSISSRWPQANSRFASDPFEPARVIHWASARGCPWIPRMGAKTPTQGGRNLRKEIRVNKNTEGNAVNSKLSLK